MWIYVWTTEPSAIYVWTTPVKEVYVWTTKVRPAWWGWRQPWANTVAYYPLTDDFNDHKWSGTLYNLTSNNAQITTLNWVKCADMNNSYCSANFVINTLPCTLVFWNKWKTVSEGIFNLAFNDSTRNWGWWGMSPLGTTALRVRYGNGTDTHSDLTYTIDTNWHLYVLSLDSSWWYLYIDGTTTTFTLKSPLSDPNWSGSPFRIGANEIWWTGWGNGYMGAVILENKARVAQEAFDYYNQTKWNYGL